MNLRSLLFVPATRLELLAKVPRWQPDAVVVDLEDAVSAGEKDAARRAVTQADLSVAGCPVLVRINAAGYYAMGAPGFEPRATLALPTATIGTMAPEASANAMYANRIAQIEDPEERAAFIAARVAEQEAELNLLRMGSELVVDAVVEPPDLRAELIARLAAADGWERTPGRRHHVVSPV